MEKSVIDKNDNKHPIIRYIIMSLFLGSFKPERKRSAYLYMLMQLLNKNEDIKEEFAEYINKNFHITKNVNQLLFNSIIAEIIWSPIIGNKIVLKDGTEVMLEDIVDKEDIPVTTITETFVKNVPMCLKYNVESKIAEETKSFISTMREFKHNCQHAPAHA